MYQSSKKDRLNDAYEYLYSKGIVHSVTELALKMKRSRAGVSRALNGAPEYLNDKFLKSFAETFDGLFSLDYLINGNGDMFVKYGESSDNVVKDAPEDPAPYIPTWADAFFDILTNQIKQNENLNRELRESIESVNQLKGQLSALIEKIGGLNVLHGA